ncbi:Sir2 family NAD-dependent protein deacetylase [Caballeronia arationis]|uniref:Sir2 family NAD-dependent protein deacetylase n=1 Tax=Caballeronia arationis TaxID=1777142 RepID=UPI001F40EECB|nr:Sir2 family NAD-dependent protein deacetylase [Caballeronia arationis]
MVEAIRRATCTSNVDGQFQTAGFPESRVHECHGSIHTLQCVDVCSNDTWPTEDVHPLLNAARAARTARIVCSASVRANSPITSST